METSSININLSAQEGGKFRKLFLVIVALGLSFLVVSLFVPDFRGQHFYLSWIAFLPGFVEALLYGLGKNQILADRLPYLRINEEKIEHSKGGLFSKPQTICWAYVKAIDIRLFEIRLTTNDNTPVTIDLNNLTDDNLKQVKDLVASIKKNKAL